VGGNPDERELHLSLAAGVKERDFLNWIIAAAEQTGWNVWHVPAPMVWNRRGGFVGSPRAAGLPDLFLLHDDPPRMIVAEVKGSSGRLSEAQRKFLSMARAVAETSAFFDGEGSSGARTFRVYAWTPDQQDIIEGIFKTKVLL
jgi:VRR-NUC domain